MKLISKLYPNTFYPPFPAYLQQGRGKKLYVTLSITIIHQGLW